MNDTYTVCEGDRLWPVLMALVNTHYDDLTEERIGQVLELVESYDLHSRLIIRFERSVI